MDRYAGKSPPIVVADSTARPDGLWGFSLSEFLRIRGQYQSSEPRSPRARRLAQHSRYRGALVSGRTGRLQSSHPIQTAPSAKMLRELSRGQSALDARAFRGILFGT